MDVVKYLYHSDLLLEDEKGLAIIGSGRYVLSVGDKVVIKQILVQDKKRCCRDFLCQQQSQSDL